MIQKLKRLLFTDEPYLDESFTGYIMRLAEMNDIPDLSWILKPSGLVHPYDYQFKFNSDLRVKTYPLSHLIEINESQLKNLLYSHQFGKTNHIVGNLLVFGQPILHHFVRRESPKICPQCLIEQNYCRKIWELCPVTVCPYHSNLLIDHCPQCHKKIVWQRPTINICPCQFDFRNAPLHSVNEEDSRLTKYLFQSFELPTQGRFIKLDYPLNTLDISDQITLFYFIGSLIAEIPDYYGLTIAKYHDNSENHLYLNKAFKIFDDWTKS